MDGWRIGRDAARASEWTAGRRGTGTQRYSLPVKSVTAGDDGTTVLTLDNKKTLSYAGECRTTLVFVDTAGQGWGTERCTGASGVKTTEGPASVTVPTAQLAGARRGTVIELLATPDGAEAYPLRVWDRKMKRVLAIGPFLL